MSTSNEQSTFVNWTSDQVRQFLLFELARRFKGIDPEVDRRIDDHAEQIVGRPGVKRVPGRFPGEPKVPLYMEGEPGVGKTATPRSAAQEFCRIAGLNYIENPPDGYAFGPKDFYFFSVNLSGKNNPMDIGGLPSKGELETKQGMEVRRRATDAGEWLLAELVSRSKAMAGLAKLSISDAPEYVNGGLRHREVTIRGDEAQVDLVLNTLLKQLSEEIKAKGVGLNLLQNNDTPQDNRLYLQVKKGKQGARVVALAPQQMEADVAYVSEMLPNRRFAMAAKAPFTLVNFDDVANAGEAVRNVLLEVAQSNRYSGVMDIGNAMVTFSGNIGAEDNTNTQSEQSDAEVSRMMKVRVRDTPKDWARRTATKYAETGDCMMPAFIDRLGNNPGIFRDQLGDARGAKGIPKPNSRSLENMLAKMLPYFVMARDMEVSPLVFRDDLEAVAKGTCGPVVATAFMGFANGMLTEAVPLAQELMNTGKLDQDKFDKHMGAGARASQQDFGFRFAAALADSFVNQIAFSDAALAAAKDDAAMSELVAVATDRMCTGLAAVEPGQMTYALSYAMARMGGISRLGQHDGVESMLKMSTYLAMAEGFGRAKVRGIWVDVKKAETDFKRCCAGSNFGGARPKAKATA